MVQAIASLPDDAGIEDGIDCLYFLLKVERGLAQAERQQTIPDDEARERVAAWLR
jgi:hypothetical protein